MKNIFIQMKIGVMTQMDSQAFTLFSINEYDHKSESLNLNFAFLLDWKSTKTRKLNLSF